MAEKKEIVLAPEHQTLAERIGFDPAVLAFVIACNLPDLRQLTVEQVGPDHCLVPVEVEGFCFEIERARGESIQRTLRERFTRKGYLFFFTELGVYRPPATLAAIRGTDPYDILRLVGTEDVNGDRTTENIIAVLREWESRYPFQITGAGRDWVECRLRKNPDDMLAFAREVIRLAPDSYSQGDYDDEAGFAAEMRRARSFHLWWD